jgi:hypothetical protein
MQRLVLACCGWLAISSPAAGQAQTVAPAAIEQMDRSHADQAAAPAPLAPAAAPQLVEVGHARVWKDKVKPWLQRTHWGYADEFHPVTFGVSVNEHFKTQICNGLAAQLVLYVYDFRNDSAAEANLLNSHGQRQLYRIARIAESTGLYPIGIEASGNAILDAARRDEVIRQLSAAHSTIPAEWVVVGRPAALGMRGSDAAEIYKGLLRNTQSQDASQVGNASSGSSKSAGAAAASPQQGSGQP